MTSPWAKIEQPDPVNLEEIISQEVARELQTKEEKRLKQNANKDFETPVEVPGDNIKTVDDNTCDNDEAIARRLQMQFDEELKKAEELNKSRKQLISFENYPRASINDDVLSDSEDEDILDADEKKFWDKFETLGLEDALQPHTAQQESYKVTEDDVLMGEIKKGCRFKLFPYRYKFPTDTDFYISAESNECDQERYTYPILHKMMEKRLLKSINGVINVGREAVILHANTNPSFRASFDLPKECVIKLFKTALSDLSGYEKPDEHDHRFIDRKGKRLSRSVMYFYAKNEMSNLIEMHKAGVPCPKLLTYKKHIVVMEFIGENQAPAPTLKEASMSDEDYATAYEQVTASMNALYNKANLIHADLTEDNILWYQKQCYFIDVSECVDPRHEKAFHALYRDCINVIRFFSGKNVSSVVSPEMLFKSITGHDAGDRVTQENIRISFKLKPKLYTKPEIQLDYRFSSLKRREN